MLSRLMKHTAVSATLVARMVAAQSQRLACQARACIEEYPHTLGIYNLDFKLAYFSSKSATSMQYCTYETYDLEGRLYNSLGYCEFSLTDGSNKSGGYPCAYAPFARYSPCIACSPGFILGNGECTLCPAGFVSPGGTTTTCTECTGGLVPDALQSQCGCPAGQSPNAAGTCIDCGVGTSSAAGVGVCAPCAAGTYQPQSGAGQCILCGAGQYSTSTGSGSADACMQCPAGSVSKAKHDGCLACATSAGQMANADQTACVCMPGRPLRRAAIPSRDVPALCSAQCTAGQYTDGTTPCLACQTGTFSTIKADACVTMCAAGQYASGLGCAACDAGQVSPAGSSTCTQCVSPMIPSQDKSKCSCPSGLYSSVQADACITECPAGQYLSSLSCKLCDADQASAAGSSSCTTCVSPMVPSDDRSKCILPPTTKARRAAIARSRRDTWR